MKLTLAIAISSAVMALANPINLFSRNLQNCKDAVSVGIDSIDASCSAVGITSRDLNECQAKVRELTDAGANVGYEACGISTRDYCPNGICIDPDPQPAPPPLPQFPCVINGVKIYKCIKTPYPPALKARQEASPPSSPSGACIECPCNGWTGSCHRVWNGCC